MKMRFSYLLNGVLALATLCLHINNKFLKVRTDMESKEVKFFRIATKIGTSNIITACNQILDQRCDIEKNNAPIKIDIPKVIQQLDPVSIMIYPDQVILKINATRKSIIYFANQSETFGDIELANGLWYCGCNQEHPKIKNLANKNGWLIDSDSLNKIIRVDASFGER